MHLNSVRCSIHCWDRHLSSAPFDKDLVCSCYGAMEDGRNQIQCTLWRIDEDEGPLQLLTDLSHPGGNFRWYAMCVLMTCLTSFFCSTVWHPSASPQLATVNESHLLLWKISDSGAQVCVLTMLSDC